MLVPAATKIELVQRLQDAGHTSIEVTSFVSPKWVPQMADNAEALSGIVRSPDVHYSVLVPNLGIDTGIDLHKLGAAGAYISAELGRAANALLKRRAS